MESEEGMLVIGMGFSFCNMRNEKNYTYLVLEWSDDPEKSIVVLGTPCTFWEYIAIGQILVGC